MDPGGGACEGDQDHGEALKRLCREVKKDEGRDAFVGVSKGEVAAPVLEASMQKDEINTRHFPHLVLLTSLTPSCLTLSH